MKRLVLLDRDGTINIEKNYLSSPDQVELIPSAADAIRLIRSLGLSVVVITNQSGISRGYFSLDTLTLVHQRLQELLAVHSTCVDAIYFCPHAPETDCDCRKPKLGMALRAANEFGADLCRSFVVGDKLCDIELGRAVGATTILVRTGHGIEQNADEKVTPDYIADDLLEAAELIQSQLEKSGEFRAVLPKTM